MESNEIVCRIISYLDTKSLLNSLHVNKTWNLLASIELWKENGNLEKLMKVKDKEERRYYASLIIILDTKNSSLELLEEAMTELDFDCLQTIRFPKFHESWSGLPVITRCLWNKCPDLINVFVESDEELCGGYMLGIWIQNIISMSSSVKVHFNKPFREICFRGDDIIPELSIAYNDELWQQILKLEQQQPICISKLNITIGRHAFYKLNEMSILLNNIKNVNDLLIFINNGPDGMVMYEELEYIIRQLPKLRRFQLKGSVSVKFSFPELNAFGEICRYLEVIKIRPQNRDQEPTWVLNGYDLNVYLKDALKGSNKMLPNLKLIQPFPQLGKGVDMCAKQLLKDFMPNLCRWSCDYGRCFYCNSKDGDGDGAEMEILDSDGGVASGSEEMSSYNNDSEIENNPYAPMLEIDETDSDVEAEVEHENGDDLYFGLTSDSESDEDILL